MRLRRIEFIALALTFAFVCFMGGYFTGSKGSVNIVTVEPQNGAVQQFSARETPGTPSQAASERPGAAPNDVSEPAPPDAAVESGGSVGQLEDTATVPDQNSGAAAGAPRGGDGRININHASRSELMDLPGIGNVIAGRIVDYRSQYGAFSSIEDIRKVSGIGEKRFEAIQDKITVG